MIIENNTIGSHKDYANVVDFGAKPNSFLDDTEAFLKAIATGNSVYIPEGIYYVSKTLKIENQNFIGSGVFQTHIISINMDKNQPILMAGRSCKITDMLLMYKEGIVTGEEKEGEHVGILMHGETWPLQRGSEIKNLRIENVGTCFYMPRDYAGGGPFSIEHANLEFQNFSFRAIDYGAKHRIGNIFSNVFMTSNMETVDSLIHLEGDEVNVSMSQMVMLNTRCRKAALSINNVKGFHISSMHIGGVSVVTEGRGLVELNNSSGEIGALSYNYIPLESDNTSLIKTYNANYDLCLTEKEVVPSNHYLRIGHLDVCGINDPSADFNYTECNDGLVYPYSEKFKFISREDNSEGVYYVEIGNYSYYTFKNDTEIYEEFKCDDDKIRFIKKGSLIMGGSTAERPRYRLCKYVTEYFDTDLGKKICWDGEKWV